MSNAILTGALPWATADGDSAVVVEGVLGEGGLAQVHGLRGGSETPGLGHGQEDFELPEGRLQHNHTLSEG